MSRRRLMLAAPYPSVNIFETIDPRTGRVRYRFRGTRAVGTIIIAPEWRGEADAIPDTVFVQFGDDAPGYHNERERPERPVINGVPLVGGVSLTPGEYLTRERGHLWLRRSTGPYTSVSVPDATNRYGSAIVRALLAHWYARPDRDELLRAGARAAAAAAHRLAYLHRHKIEPARRQIEELTAELAAHHALAAQLCQLAGEYEYLHGAERAAAPQPATAGGKVQP